jgi:hypothetical protein
VQLLEEDLAQVGGEQPVGLAKVRVAVRVGLRVGLGVGVRAGVKARGWGWG